MSAWERRRGPAVGAPPRPRAWPALLATLLALGLGAHGAHAKPRPAGAGESRREPNEAAAELDVMGKDAYKARRYDDAVAAYEAAFEADPLPRFLFNLARCHQKRGDLGRAAHLFERYLKAAPEAKDRRKVKALAKVLRVKLKKRFSKLEVVSEPTGALVVVKVGEGVVEGATPLTEWLPFGEHTVAVSLSGYERHEEVAVLRPRAPTRLEVKLVAKRKPAPPAPEPEPAPAEVADAAPELAAEPAPEPSPPPAPKPGRGWLVPSTLSVAGALLAGGGVLSWLARDAEQARDALVESSWSKDVTASEVLELDDRAATRATAANVLLGTGLFAAAAGAVLLLVADGEEAGATSVWLVPGPSGPALAVGGTL